VQSGIVVPMNASAFGILGFAATLPARVLLILGGGMGILLLLIYLGIALPAVWSAKPARRKAAADVLAQIFGACTRASRR
jgi:hypothetical protein